VSTINLTDRLVSTINFQTGGVQPFTVIDGGPFTRLPPAAVGWAGHREVFVVDTSGNLWHNIASNGGPFSGWGQLFAASLCGAPSATSCGPGRVDVFAPKCDGNLFHAVGINNSWNWGVFQGFFRSVVVSPAGARLDVWSAVGGA
jgi:hypothetical protein